MSEQTMSIEAKALIESAETMAFVSLFPAEGPCVFDDRTLHVNIPFTGPFAGSLELVAPEAFGAMLAGNMLGCEPSECDALERADDAVKELMNITCGAVLADLADGGTRGFEMGLPRVEPLGDVAGWQAYAEAHRSNVFDADGHRVVVRFTKGAR